MNADAQGKETYRSDPINFWHTHICASADGSLLGGEGTHDHMYVYGAHFDPRSTTVDFVALATIHSKYHPFSAASVNCLFLEDSRTLVYGDTINGTMQLCAVEVEI